MSRELLRGLFDAIDAQDSEAFANFVAAFFDSIAGLRHVPGKTIEDDDTLVVEGEVTYTRKDGRQVPLPFANVLRLHGARIGDYRIYTDLGPLYAD